MNNAWKFLINALKKVVGRLFTRTTATFLLFLVLAFALWLLQKESSGEFNVGIPVAYINKPGDIRIDSELPSSVSVSLKVEQGNALSLFRRRSHDTIYVDLANYHFNNSGMVKYPADSLLAAASDLYPGFLVQRCVPSVIDMRYSRMRQKTVKVIFADADSIKLAPSCIMSGPITIEPKEITVYGTHLDSINIIRLKHLKRKVYDQAVTEYIPIAHHIKGLSYSDTVVRVHIPVERAIERRVTVAVDVENRPNDTILHVFPSEVELIYAVPIGQTEEYDPSLFRVAIDYRSININTKSCALKVTSLPEGISNVSLDKTEVSVLLEKVGSHN